MFQECRKGRGDYFQMTFKFYFSCRRLLYLVNNVCEGYILTDDLSNNSFAGLWGLLHLSRYIAQNSKEEIIDGLIAIVDKVERNKTYALSAEEAELIRESGENLLLVFNQIALSPFKLTGDNFPDENNYTSPLSDLKDEERQPDLPERKRKRAYSGQDSDKKRRGMPCTRVIEMSDPSTIYSSISEAANRLGLPISSVSYALRIKNGKLVTRKGRKYEFARIE